MFIKVDEEKEQPSLPGFSLLDTEEAWERPVSDGERVNLRSMKNLEQVTEGPGEVVESLFSSLGFEEIFGVSSRGEGNTEVLKKCLANPSSKRGMSRWLEDDPAAQPRRYSRRSGLRVRSFRV